MLSKVYNCRELIAGKLPIFILVTKMNGLFKGHGARLSGFVDSPKDAQSLRLVPEYYRDDKLSVCALLTTPFKPIQLDGFFLQSNNRPLVEVLSQCRTATMLVHD